MKLTIEQALQQGVAAHKEGKLQEAERLYRAIIQSQPKHPDANHNLGVIAASVNQADAALPMFRAALEANPKIEQFWLSYIDALIKEKQFDNAKQVLEQAKKQGVVGEKLNALDAQLAPETQIENVSSASPSEQQLNSLLEYYQTGQYGDAESSALSLTQEFPKHQFGWKVLGILYGQSGRNSEAVNANQSAVELSPQDAEAHYNLGITLKELDRLEEAEASYTQAVALKPNFAEAHYNLGNTLKELERLDEAEASLRQAVALKPDYAEAHSNLGITLKELERLDEAEASLRQAVALKPDYAEAHLNLCELLEKMNRRDEVLFVIRNASGKVFDKESDFLYYEALTEFRNENYETAEELIKKINRNELLEKRKPLLMRLQADLYHHKKAYSAAFEEFKSMNEHVKHSQEYKKQESENYFNHQRESLFQIEQLQQQTLYNSIIKPRWIQPTFLIGFPRSGTTLLDTILRTHSKIDVVEELPMLDKVKKTVWQSLGHVPTISMIEKMDNAAAEIASGFYLEELKKHIEVGKKQIVIDKLPLNILQLPLINQIFPEARFILALRHPLDCVLSCWMQNFKLNPAMANMVDLDRIVDFYCTAMEIFKLSQKRYSLNTYRIRYEDLVLNFEGEVSNILGFLDLKWEEGLRSYQKTALARGGIKTPSYPQVIKPIYKTASYRWKNYEKYLNPFKGRLEPWLRDYDYLD
jgi:Flp pilus assembly protein TadD